MLPRQFPLSGTRPCLAIPKIGSISFPCHKSDTGASFPLPLFETEGTCFEEVSGVPRLLHRTGPPPACQCPRLTCNVIVSGFKNNPQFSSVFNCFRSRYGFRSLTLWSPSSKSLADDSAASPEGCNDAGSTWGGVELLGGFHERHLSFGGEGAVPTRKPTVPTDARSEFLANRAMGDWAERVIKGGIVSWPGFA